MFKMLKRINNCLQYNNTRVVLCTYSVHVHYVQLSIYTYSVGYGRRELFALFFSCTPLVGPSLYYMYVCQARVFLFEQLILFTFFCNFCHVLGELGGVSRLVQIVAENLHSLI